MVLMGTDRPRRIHQPSPGAHVQQDQAGRAAARHGERRPSGENDDVVPMLQGGLLVRPGPGGRWPRRGPGPHRGPRIAWPASVHRGRGEGAAPPANASAIASRCRSHTATPDGPGWSRDWSPRVGSRRPRHSVSSRKTRPPTSMRRCRRSSTAATAAVPQCRRARANRVCRLPPATAGRRWRCCSRWRPDGCPAKRRWGRTPCRHRRCFPAPFREAGTGQVPEPDVPIQGCGYKQIGPGANRRVVTLCA